MGRKARLEGKRFGKLTVLSETDKRNNQGCVLWECFCDCGNTSFVATSWLNSGNTTSCGCKHIIDKEVKHGMSNTRIYAIWLGILSRCNNPKARPYTRYGGRGITVCDRWNSIVRGSFENFLEDMQSGYTDEMTLERKDVNREYSLENCEWILKKDQALNKGRYKNNKTGYTGITEQDRKYGMTLVATIQNPETGKAVSKTRNLLKISREQAILELVAWLEEKRREFGYKETHGTF